MQEAQAEVNPQWWRDSDFTIVAGENAGYEILNSPARPSAIFAVNDDLAIGVMAAAHRLGLEIGRDVSLVGYNDIPLVSRLPIPLTSVKTPLDQLASHAVELLLGHHVENPQRYSLPTLIPRASTRPYRKRRTFPTRRRARAGNVFNMVPANVSRYCFLLVRARFYSVNVIPIRYRDSEILFLPSW